MARYVYTGDGPHDATMIGGGFVRPGDIRDDLPDWGAWTLVPEPKKPAPPPPPPAPVAAPAPAPVPAPAPAPPLPTPAPAPAAATPAPPQNGS